MVGVKRKAADDIKSHPSKKAVAAAATAAPPSAPKSPLIDPNEQILSTSNSLFEYLEHLPPHALKLIYALPPPRGPLVAAAVIRSSSLTDIARQVALRLLACGGSFKIRTIVECWVHRHSRGNVWVALRRLECMGILNPLGLASSRDSDDNLLGVEAGDDDDEGGNNEAKRNKLMEKDACLTQEFKVAMSAYLITSCSSPWPLITRPQIEEYKRQNTGSEHSKKEDGEKESKPSRDPPSLKELETYTQSSWDSVLHFLVGSDENDRGEGIKEPDDAMIAFLTQIGLMQPDPDYKGKDKSRAPLVITSKGYEFMLRDPEAQKWQFVLQYLNASAQHEQKDQIRVEALSVLICLGSCKVGEGFHMSVLGSKYARVVIRDYARFGLLFPCRVAGRNAFYPTNAVVNLVASSEKAGREASAIIGQSIAASRALEEALAAPIPSRSHLALVVQTNFQVVAYTRSKLHISTLGLFCDISTYRKLPNVIFFHITRDSIRSAFRLGVLADQILRFLHVHAHPMLRNGDQPLVPSNVIDQILLWDKERHRVVMDEVWVHQCRDDAEFAAARQYALDMDALAWGAAHTNKLYIHIHYAEQVSAYVRRWRTKKLAK